MRTQEELQRQITGLEKQREALPEIGYFGGNNWDKIDYQISILSGHEKYIPGDEDDDDYDDGYDDAGWEADAWLGGVLTEDLFDEEFA